MMILNYKAKKDILVGEKLNYTETSMFGPEYKANGTFCGCNRPSITGIKGREFFAEVTMVNGLVAKVK